MEKALLVRLPTDLHEQLRQNRQRTGTSAAEYIRRAVRLALFADDQSANRNAAKREPVQYALKAETR